MKTLFTVFAIALACYGQQISADQLIAEAAQAELANKDRMRNWLSREDVRMHYLCKAGVNAPPDRTFAYDAQMLEGEPYFKRIEEDGRPLSGAAALEEARKMDAEAVQRKQRAEAGIDVRAQSGRTEYPLELVPEFHSAKWAANAQLRAVETKPRKKDSSPDLGRRIVANSSTKVWIDPTTDMPRKAQITMQAAVGQWPKGTVIEVENVIVDDGWLAARIRAVVPLTGANKVPGCSSLEATQTLSNFRKFQSESTIVFDPVQ